MLRRAGPTGRSLGAKAGPAPALTGRYENIACQVNTLPTADPLQPTHFYTNQNIVNS